MLQAPHLQAAQSKIKEIYKAVKVVHPQAEARVVRFIAFELISVTLFETWGR